MNPIHIDLRNLTQAHIDEAFPNLEGCRYQDPCIIGTLIPPELRAKADRAGFSWDEDNQNGSDNVDTMLNRNLFEMPVDQHQLAEDLQKGFDQGDLLLFKAALDDINRKFGLNLKVPTT